MDGVLDMDAVEFGYGVFSHKSFINNCFLAPIDIVWSIVISANVSLPLLDHKTEILVDITYLKP